MAVDPHSAFQALINAWEEFHAAVIDTEDGEAPRVLRAADHLADAYTVYDDVLFTTYGVEAPFDTYEDNDGDDADYEDGEAADYEDFDPDYEDSASSADYEDSASSADY